MNDLPLVVPKHIDRGGLQPGLASWESAIVKLADETPAQIGPSRKSEVARDHEPRFSYANIAAQSWR